MKHMRRPIRAALVGILAVVSLLSWNVSPAQAEIPDDWPYPEDLDTTEPAEQGPGNPGEQTSVVQYGPYTAQVAPQNPDGTHGHWHSGNQFAFGVEKPCNNCYITSMKADLVVPDGSSVGRRDDLQLHHMVLFNTDAGRSDATCAFPLGLLGQRFFASGDERTLIQAPQGTGYYTGNGGWNLIWDLASTLSDQPQDVYYQVTFTWVPGSADMVDLEPVWFDVDQCGDSNVDVPAGSSQQSWTWNVNRPGYLVGIGGHLHNYGTHIEIRNDSTGEMLCDSVAAYGGDPMYVDHHGGRNISAMSTCGGMVDWDPVTRLSSGQRVTITSHYDAVPEPTNDAMGIVIGFIAEEPPDGGGGGNGDCIEATNGEHRDAGRAEGFLFLTAVGSGASLGLWFQTTSLEETSPGVWELC